MNKEKRQRIVWIDWAKAILIALVCVGHFNSPETQKQLIWGCHMPAFFVVSGYLYHRRSAWKTLYSFAVPMIFYAAMVFGFHIVQDVLQNGSWDYRYDFGHFWYRIVEQFFIRNGENPYGIIHVIGVWFVVALIVARFLCGDIKFFSFTLKYRYWVLGALMVWLTIEPLIWDYVPIKDVKLYYGIYAMPFFLTGYILKDNKVDFHKIRPVYIMILLAIYVVVSLSLKRFDMMNYQCGPTFVVFYLTALCGSIVLFWFTTFLPQNRIVEIFSLGTLLLLTLHMPLDFFVLPVFHRLGLTPPNSMVMEFLIPWIEMCVVFFICYFPILWLNKKCPILLGKLPKRTQKETPNQ